MKDTKKELPPIWGATLVGSVGIILVTSTFVGMAIGYFLDKWLKTTPVLTIIFLVLGIIAGFWNGYAILKKGIEK